MNLIINVLIVAAVLAAPYAHYKTRNDKIKPDIFLTVGFTLTGSLIGALLWLDV